MKQLICFLGLLFLTTGALAQSNNSPFLSGGGMGTDVIKIENWGAFSSDSVALSFSQSFNMADYDTLDIWALGASVTGVAKWSASLWGGFASTVSTTNFDSIGVAADTANVKLETLQYIGSLPTKGAVLGAIRVSGSSASIHTPADSKVSLYIVGRKRDIVARR